MVSLVSKLDNVLLKAWSVIVNYIRLIFTGLETSVCYCTEEDRTGKCERKREPVNFEMWLRQTQMSEEGERWACEGAGVWGDVSMGRQDKICSLFSPQSEWLRMWMCLQWMQNQLKNKSGIWNKKYENCLNIQWVRILKGDLSSLALDTYIYSLATNKVLMCLRKRSALEQTTVSHMKGSGNNVKKLEKRVFGITNYKYFPWLLS